MDWVRIQTPGKRNGKGNVNRSRGHTSEEWTESKGKGDCETGMYSTVKALRVARVARRRLRTEEKRKDGESELHWEQKCHSRSTITVLKCKVQHGA